MGEMADLYQSWDERRTENIEMNERSRSCELELHHVCTGEGQGGAYCSCDCHVPRSDLALKIEHDHLTFQKEVARRSGFPLVTSGRGGPVAPPADCGAQAVIIDGRPETGGREKRA